MFTIDASPTIIVQATSTCSRSAAARKRSGSGLAHWTWSRVIVGVVSGSPRSSSAGRAVTSRPLVTIAHGMARSSSEDSRSRAPGRAATVGKEAP
jgi:hypothetical protein